MGNFPALKSALADPENNRRIKEAFKAYDTDRSGYLSRSEFGTLAVNILTLIETGPHGAELRKGLGVKSPTQFANEMFDKYDVDGNKKISYEEFESLISLSRG